MADPRKTGGFALIVILWIVAIMGAITILFTRNASLALKISRNTHESIAAELVAEGAIFRMMALLKTDEQETPSDHESETWGDDQASFFDIPLGKGVYRIMYPDPTEANMVKYGAMDECGKLNINTATRDMLLALPNAVPDCVDPILDWRDEDTNPREFGAEDEYYGSMEEPFLTKNALFDTVDELMLLKGMTVDILYGEDINANGVLDANENDADISYPLDNADGQLDRGWYPYITCYSYEKNVDSLGGARVNVNSANKEKMKEVLGETLQDRDFDAIIEKRNSASFQNIGEVWDVEGINKEEFKEIADKITISDEEKLQGRVNINTAPREVLLCLFGEENENLVQDLLEYRESGDGPFEHVGQLLDIEGVNANRFKQVANYISTKSSVYSVRAAGYVEATKTYKEIMAIIDRGDDVPQIRYWKVLR